jgi:hypothetical protein
MMHQHLCGSPLLQDGQGILSLFLASCGLSKLVGQSLHDVSQISPSSC